MVLVFVYLGILCLVLLRTERAESRLKRVCVYTHSLNEQVPASWEAQQLNVRGRLVGGKEMERKELIPKCDDSFV